MYTGWIITILVIVPNLIAIIYPPKNIPQDGQKSQMIGNMEILERIGQVACFAIPCLYRLDGSNFKGIGMISLAVMVVCLGLYYYGWGRYALSGRDFQLLFSPYLGLPLPMAVLPVAYFFAAAVLLRSPYLFAAAAVLAVGHIYVSQKSHQEDQ
ncbi:MAG TPA: hypothetical protein VMT46_18905 [Anaerolineaceae bacterium]|nr:hypothetical protein [Anaerolineaceae bacterium]